MAWNIEGRYFENCTCNNPCPCNVSLDLGADYDQCQFVLAFHVDSGEIEGVDVSGLTVAVVGDTPKFMLEGNWRLGILMDENASDEQAEKLAGVLQRRHGRPDGGARASGRRAARHGTGVDGLLFRGPGTQARPGHRGTAPSSTTSCPSASRRQAGRLVGIFHPVGKRSGAWQGRR